MKTSPLFFAKTMAALVFSSLFFSCRTPKNISPSMLKKADEIAHRYVIFDGHVDLPYRLKAKNFRLEKEFIGIPIDEPRGDFDFKRAKKGGLSAPFMSIYIPSSYQKDGGSQELADSLIRMIEFIARSHPDKFALAPSTKSVSENFGKGLTSLPLGMENGAPIEKIEDVKFWHSRGIRYVTLTHGKDNQICDSSYDTTQTWNGLSPFGEKIVLEMNRVGVMVDVSHVSDSAFFDVLKITKVPVIASHSSCRKFTPDWPRNLNDDQILAIKKNGGVICINFGSTFLDADVKAANRETEKLWGTLLKEKGLQDESEAAEKLKIEFKKTHPNVYSDVRKVADHIDHVRRLAGIDHIGLGSDFDGVGDSLPTGLKDVSMYPNLLAELLRRGYSEADLAKICSGNVFRVWRATEAAATGK